MPLVFKELKLVNPSVVGKIQIERLFISGRSK